MVRVFIKHASSPGLNPQHHRNGTWWYTPVIQNSGGRNRQEDQKLKDILSYIMSLRSVWAIRFPGQNSRSTRSSSSSNSNNSNNNNNNTKESALN